MSRYGRDPEEIERDIYRGLVVQEFCGVDALEYLATSKERGQ